jgi:hypothetical protein
MPAVMAASCLLRRELSLHLTQQLRLYHQTFSGLLASETVERATDQALPLYQACVEARRELQVHEKIHACHREILDELEV